MTGRPSVSFHDRLAAVRALRDAGQEAAYLEAAKALAVEAPGDLDVRVEAAYACDRLGSEEDAAGHYDAAYRMGIEGDRRAGFLLGYGSTLRNVGRLDESVTILRAACDEFPGNRALQAFLSLSQHAAGARGEAFVTAFSIVTSLASADPELASYARALAYYRDELARPPGHPSTG